MFINTMTYKKPQSRMLVLAIILMRKVLKRPPHPLTGIRKVDGIPLQNAAEIYLDKIHQGQLKKYEQRVAIAGYACLGLLAIALLAWAIVLWLYAFSEYH